MIPDFRNMLSRMYTTPCMACFAPRYPPEMKPAGITVDLSTVAVTTEKTTLLDGSCLPAGVKVMRFGQVLTMINASGKYGPYDPDATDGRQTLTRGQAFILNQSRVWHQHERDDQIGGVFDAGSVVREHLIVSSGDASLADGPEKAVFEAVFPGINYAV